MTNQPEKIREDIRKTISEANTVFKDERIENLITQISFEFYKKGFKEAIKSVKYSADSIENHFINGLEK